MPDEIDFDVPLTNADRFLPPSALAIIERAENVRYMEGALYEANMARANEINEQRAVVLRAEAENQRRIKPSDAVSRQNAAALKKLDAQLATAKFSKGYSASIISLVKPFAVKVNRPHVEFGMVDELIPGETAQSMFDHVWRGRQAEARAQLRLVEFAPVPLDEAESNINKSVDAVARRAGLNNALMPGGRVNFPMRRYARGGELFGDQIDVEAVLFDVFGDQIKKTYIKRLLKDFDKSECLTKAQRKEATDAANAAILHAERKAAYWHRVCTDSGLDDPGKPYVTNPLALLDIELAK